MMQIKKYDNQWYKCYYSIRNNKYTLKRRILIENYEEGQTIIRRKKRSDIGAKRNGYTKKSEYWTDGCPRSNYTLSVN